MKKAKDAIKRQLKEQWQQACNGFLVELLRMWELDAHYGYWIGDETGGVYDYGDGMLTINMDDIIYCVLNDVTREQYEEWQQYICDASEFGFATPNLRSFVRGCPRTPPETFQHLRELKATLNDAIRDEKERERRRAEKGMKTHAEQLAEREAEIEERLNQNERPDGLVVKLRDKDGNIGIETSCPKAKLEDYLPFVKDQMADCFTSFDDFRKKHPEFHEMHFLTEHTVWEKDLDEE